MATLFGARETLSPLVRRRRVPVHAETVLFKCQCEVRPRPALRPRHLATLKMSHATQRNQFRICIHRPDTGRNRFIGLMRFTLSFNLLPHSSVLFIGEFARLY